MAARIIPITIQRATEAPPPPPPQPPQQTTTIIDKPAPSTTASPSPPPASNTSTTTSIDEMATNPRPATMALIRNRSIDDFNEQVVNMLDEVEKRVEQLREAASMLEQEKEQILDMLNSVSLNTELLRLGQGDREDITAITNRLAARTKTVDVSVNTPRSSEQERALSSVNSLIEGVVEKMHEDMQAGKEACRRYLNACNPDQPDGPIDQRFQAQLIECTADDQKKIRRKLAQIISQFERAERTFTPQW
ncbi:hypothetical protein V3C99_016096 [Haemonchus contortus]|uniref:BAG family molecular chaperone regulator 2 n=2 Tax=Haemonchus contortus TaxID=6289 RepID=A0A7I5EDK4_HAECO